MYMADSTRTYQDDPFDLGAVLVIDTAPGAPRRCDTSDGCTPTCDSSCNSAC